MNTIGIVGVLLVGLGAAACGGSAGPNGGTAGASGSAGGTGSSGVTGTAGSSGAGTAGAQGSCGTVQPCGGVVVGVWKATTVCILDNSIFMADTIKQSCPTADLVPTGLSVAGTSTYNADKTFVDQGTLTLGLKLTLPLSCFAPGKDCAGLQAVYVQMGNFDAPTCVVQGTACVCSLVSTQDTTDMGTYSTSGTTVTHTGTDGTPSVDSYCVKGNELHSIGVDMSMPMGPMGMAKIQGDVVFTKQ